jgi:hypothetical protein
VKTGIPGVIELIPSVKTKQTSALWEVRTGNILCMEFSLI